MTWDIETEYELKDEILHSLKLWRRNANNHDRQTSQDDVVYESKSRSMSGTILDRMDFYYLIVLLTKKINLRRKERKKNKTKLLYIVSNPIRLMLSLRKLASEF
jgi:hypothetical protein